MSPADLFEQLRAVLATRPPNHLGALPQGVARASVLVPFFARDGEPHMLFLKRPDGQYRHAGQVAFPGGQRDPGESALACALREAHEEVGIRPADVDLLGELDEYDTVVTGFRVTPMVGIIPWPYPLEPNPREVERLIPVPLSKLLDPKIFRVQTREALGHVFPIYFYTVGEDLIWGVTAGMLTPLLEIVRQIRGVETPLAR